MIERFATGDCVEWTSARSRSRLVGLVLERYAPLTNSEHYRVVIVAACDGRDTVGGVEVLGVDQLELDGSHAAADDTYAGLVQAAEVATGLGDLQLQRLLDLLRARIESRLDTRDARIYPILLALTGPVRERARP